MCDSPVRGSPADVVAALRAAGCVFAEDEAELLCSVARSPADLAAMVQRRATGEPIEAIVGWAEFCGLRIAVTPGVFVPRRRTEFLAAEAVALALAVLAVDPVVVVDLCCGSGAVGAAVLAAIDPVELHATDIDPTAVRCAETNIGAGGQVHRGDLYQPLPASLRGRVDVLVANAPYVPTAEIAMLPSEARAYEAHVALDGGPDGLGVVRRVILGAPAWLAPGGSLVVETSRRQAPAAGTALGRQGLVARVARSEELDATVVVGTRARGRLGRHRPDEAHSMPVEHRH